MSRPPECPDCAGRVAEPRAQCEQCNTVLPESELHIERVPGAVLAFCPECVKR